jgi:hypothetical protein
MSSAKSLTGKLSTPKRTALERLDLVEVQVQHLDANIRSIAQEFNNTDSVVEAMVELWGATVVGEKMLEIKHRKMEEKADGHQAAFDKAVEDGKLLKVEASSKTDIIIVTQQAAVDGTVLYPSRVFLPIGGYTEETRALFGFADGKFSKEMKTGDKFEMPGTKEGDPIRGTITVLAIYEPVAKQAKAEAAVAPAADPLPAPEAVDGPALPTESVA